MNTPMSDAKYQCYPVGKYGIVFLLRIFPVFSYSRKFGDVWRSGNARLEPHSKTDCERLWNIDYDA